MIFAAITGTPCIVTGSLSPKLKGCYEWIKECDYIEFSDDLGHLSELLEKLDSETGSYDHLKMREQFEPLVKCITACVNGKDE
jgi:pyruvyl transferase EpsI